MSQFIHFWIQLYCQYQQMKTFESVRQLRSGTKSNWTNKVLIHVPHQFRFSIFFFCCFSFYERNKIMASDDDHSLKQSLIYSRTDRWLRHIIECLHLNLEHSTQICCLGISIWHFMEMRSWTQTTRMTVRTESTNIAVIAFRWIYLMENSTKFTIQAIVDFFIFCDSCKGEHREYNFRFSSYSVLAPHDNVVTVRMAYDWYSSLECWQHWLGMSVDEWTTRLFELTFRIA